MKLLGGILLIIGTTIGGGMLALPISTSPVGFMHSSLLLLGCWIVMTISAFLLLEVNLWLPNNTSISSMARVTLGRSGQVIAWITCLLLFYSLLAAYIAGVSDYLRSLLAVIHISIPDWSIATLFTLILGYVVIRGVQSVDHVNRVLMFVKLGSLFLLLGFVLPNASTDKLLGGEWKYIAASTTVVLTSFGFAPIIPSLRNYFDNDIKKLRFAILVGSLIPLIFYILWGIAIMGVIPREGDHGLMTILHSGRSTSEFVNELSVLLQKETITRVARIFTSVCLLTSFLGVALSLSDFLADGLKLTKSRKHNVLLYLATFLLPLLIVLIYPGAFIAALSYAGIYCVILLILMPAMMVWVGRYRKNLSKDSYRVMGGKFLLIALMIIGLVIIGESVSVMNF